jgi:AbrB family looped-hinge helix DNA binding protein
MRTTIDKAGRLVIPKALRERLGLHPGEVELTPDGSGLRIEAVAGDDHVEESGRLVIPPAGTPVDDELVRALRNADQR